MSSNSTNTNNPIVSLSKDKYDKLITEFQKIKSNNSLLIKAVKAEQNKCSSYKLEMESKERELREKIEENDVLSFNNRRLEKRLAQLMFDLQDKGKESFISSILTKGFSANDEEVNKLKKEYEVLKEELESKIQENEHVHIQIFELKQSHDSTVARHKEELSELQIQAKQKQVEIEKLMKDIEDIQKRATTEKELMGDHIVKLKADIKRREDVEKELKKFSENLQSEVVELKTYVKRKVPFDDTKSSKFNVINLPSYDRMIYKQKAEVSDRLVGILKQANRGLGALYLCAHEKVQLLIKTKPHSQIVKYVNNKLTSDLPTNNVTNHRDEKPPINNSSNAGTYYEHNSVSNNLMVNMETLVSHFHKKMADFKDSLLSTSDLLQNTNVEPGLGLENLANSQFELPRAQLRVAWKSIEQWLKFHRQSFLYVVIAMQDRYCALTTAELQSMYDEYDTNATSNNEADTIQNFGEVFMQNTKLTKLYHALYTSVDQLLEYISSICMNDQEMMDRYIRKYFPKNTPDVETDHGQKGVFNEYEEFFSETSRPQSQSLPTIQDRWRSRSLSDPSKYQKAQQNENQHNSNGKKKMEDNTINLTSHEELLMDNVFMCIKDLAEHISLLNGQEQSYSFVSPSIKLSNEKINQAFSVTINILKRLIEIYRELLKIKQKEDMCTSKGILCDYSKQSVKSYYKDNHLSLNYMKARARQFIRYSSLKQHHDCQLFENISQEDAVKHKKEMQSLKKQVEHLQSETQQFKLQTKHLQDQLGQVNQTFDLLESQLAESLIQFHTFVQRYTNIDIDDEHDSNIYIGDQKSQHLNEKISESDINEKFSISSRKSNFLSNLQKFDQFIQKAFKQCFEQQELIHSLSAIQKPYDNTVTDISLSKGEKEMEQKALPSTDFTQDQTSSNVQRISEEDSNVKTPEASPRSRREETNDLLLSPSEQPVLLLDINKTEQKQKEPPKELNAEEMKDQRPDNEVKHKEISERDDEVENRIQSVGNGEVILSQSGNSTIRARLPTQHEMELFSNTIVNREQKLQSKFQRQIQYLLIQLEVCDMKCVEYRDRWQQTIFELEKACEREKNLTLQLDQVKQMLEHTQDELQSVSRNYDHQIGVLTEKIAAFESLQKEQSEQQKSFIDITSFWKPNKK